MTVCRHAPRKFGKVVAVAVLVLGVAACQSDVPPPLPASEAKVVTPRFEALPKKLPPRTIVDLLQALDSAPEPKAPQELGLVGPDASAPLSKGPRALGKFFLSRGRARASVGRIEEARADFLAAYGLLSRGRHPVVLKRQAILAVANSDLAFGNFEGAIDRYQEVIDLPGRFNSQRFSARATIAFLQLRMGDLEKAQQTMATADAIYASARSWPIWGEFYPNWVSSMTRRKARFLEFGGNFVEAEKLYRESIDALEKYFRHDDPAVRRPVMLNYHNTGALLVARSRLANNLLRQGRRIEAELVARRAFWYALRHYGARSPRLAQVLMTIASTQTNRVFKIVLARRALSIIEQNGFPKHSLKLNQAKLRLARFLVRQRRWQLAMREFDAVRANLAAHPKVFRLAIGGAGLEWAMTLIRRGRAAEAIPIARASLRHREARLGPDRYPVAEARGILASALSESGDEGGALDAFARAVPVLARVRDRGIRQRRGFIFESYVELLSRRSERQTESQIDAIYGLAETLRGHSVRSAISANAVRIAAGNPALTELVRRDQDSERQLNALRTILVSLADRSKESGNADRSAGLDARIVELQNRQVALRAEIAEKFPRFAELSKPPTATLRATRSALRPSEALIATYVGERSTYVWAVPKSGKPAFAVVPLGRSGLAKMVKGLRRALNPDAATLGDIPAFDTAAAHRLFRTLLAPVNDGWKDADTLLVVAHRSLGQLPFSVLVTAPHQRSPESGALFADYRSVPFLARSHSVAAFPSISSLIALRGLPAEGAARRSFVGFGDPLFNKGQLAEAERESLRSRSAAPAAPDAVAVRGLRLERRSTPDLAELSSANLSSLPRLPDTSDEIKGIARVMNADPARDVFIGRDANEGRVKSMDLTGYKVVAFATHGLVPGDLDGLTQPALALSSPEVAGGPDDGVLTMAEVLRLKLNADWVVLSACNTASGEGAGAEAVSGLGRAFFYAGSRALLVSNWPVETTSARALTTDLFRRQSEDTALNRVEALRQSMLNLIDRGGYLDGRGRMVFSYAHPIFWAPFAIVGDGGIGKAN